VPYSLTLSKLFNSILATATPSVGESTGLLESSISKGPVGISLSLTSSLVISVGLGITTVSMLFLAFPLPFITVISLS